MRFALTDVRTLIALALLGMLTGPACAGDCVERPFEFHGNNDGQIVEAQGNCFVAVGTGTATHMGDVITINDICQYGFRAVNHNTLIAADGDELYSIREVEWNPDTQRFEGPFTIVGGTGRFEGATGGGWHYQRDGSYGVICY